MKPLSVPFRSSEPVVANLAVLHVEDSVNDAVLIEDLLSAVWPHCRIRRVSTRAEYQSELKTRGFDIILSDYTLPDFDGLTALELARASCPEKPFIFISGTIGEERAIEALKRGAVDYVIKDRPSRLVPAIRQALSVVHETEQRRQAEEALRQSEERFRQITENVDDLIAVFDLQGCRIYCNPAYSKILGGSGARGGDESFHEIHPEDRERIRALFRRTVETGVGERSEYRFLLPDGSVRHIESQDSVIRDADGQVRNVLVVSRDVTARRKADECIREQAALLDKARDAIVATDLEHRITYWNASAERLYGWLANEAVGRRLEELNLGFEPTRFASAQAQLFATGEWRGDFRLRTRRGETVHVESTWSLVMERNGQPRSILFIDTDVTERKKLEVQLLRRQRLESVGMLAGGVAHDINNVLTPILVGVELLRGRLGNADDCRIIENVEASAQHGAALVQQLLAFARGGDSQRAEVRINPLITELKKLLESTLRTVQLSVRLDAEPWAIMADATQLNQVLMNLCINARDAMPAGGQIEISTDNVIVNEPFVRLSQRASPGPYLHIAVSDTGSGIPSEIIDKIFDPFFTTKVAGKGTGLGLSMVAGIIEGHGGFVNVESTVGQGTVFHLFLPAMTSQPTVPAVLRPSPIIGGSGETILLIEDDQAVRETLAALLTQANYRVIVASSGLKGLAAFERERATVSVVITDMILPEMNGIEVIQTLRERDPDLRIIAMSGFMDPESLKALPLAGPLIESLSKPLTADVLLSALRRVLAPAAQ